MRPQSSLDGATSDNDEDQWTIVQSKKGRSRRRPTPDHQDFATPTNPAPQLDLQQITRDHDRISAAWREGASYGKLRDIISANLGSHVTLTNAVCLAVGSFDPVPERYTYKRTAHVQLEAFRAMVEILGLHKPEICLACMLYPTLTISYLSRGTQWFSYTVYHPGAGLQLHGQRVLRVAWIQSRRYP